MDLAKRVFQVHGYPRQGRRVLTRRLSRARFQGFFEREAQPGATVVMEACGGAHFWGRWLRARGFAPVLLPPRRVRRFVTGNKTDAADAEALAVAWRCGQLHPVPIKTETQQAIQLLHRLRERRLAARTAVSNQIRALLREYGVVAPAGAAALSRTVAELRQADAPLAPPVQALLVDLVEEWRQLRASVARLDEQLTALYQAHEPCRRLGEIPGIGVV
ncbi:IS110 family transposase, partial [Salinisphaera sp. PC39]|uniref:IS110 family transposase n=1 Tax=Salinisphaera sp. PC39 TaxID=1304156 RepID=UPI00333F6A8F